jgi:undecaprenyl-diphosphatase
VAVLGLDRDAFLWVIDHRAGPLDPLFVGLSIVGYAGAVWIALAAGLAAWARMPIIGIAARCAACVWTADLLSLGIKALVERPRPFNALPGVDTLLGGTVGTSFPSGHAATSVAGAAIGALLVRQALPALTLLGLAIGYSRVYVGAHYPLDVLGGAALGGAVALAFALGLRLRGRPSAARPRSGGPRRRG